MLSKTGNQDIAMNNGGKTMDGYLLFMHSVRTKLEHVSSVEGKEQRSEKDRDRGGRKKMNSVTS